MEKVTDALQEMSLIKDSFTCCEKSLTDEEKQRLVEQDKRQMSDFKKQQMLAQQTKMWDLFYKRNETRFFKDRRWTTREFQELLTEDVVMQQCGTQKRILLEVGCGVGNLIFPLIEGDKESGYATFYYYACDFSKRAVDFVRSNALYDEAIVKAFQCDITQAEQLHCQLPESSIDVITMIFVLSAIHPSKFSQVIHNLKHILKPGGLILFRDYGRYDMAQLRFKAGHKLDENLYLRQDGTSSYFFKESELSQLFRETGFEVVNNCYVHRRTLNVKEGIDVPRIFLQGKFRKIS